MKLKFKPFPHFLSVKELNGPSGQTSWMKITLDKNHGDDHVYDHELSHVMEFWVLFLLSTFIGTGIGVLFPVIGWTGFLFGAAIGVNLHRLLYKFSSMYRWYSETLAFATASTHFIGEHREEYIQRIANFLPGYYNCDQYTSEETKKRIYDWIEKLEN